MERRLGWIAVALVLATAAAGCLGGEDESATIVHALDVHPPDDDEQNRSDIEDFETLEVAVKAIQAYGVNGTAPYDQVLDKPIDLTEVVNGTSEELDSLTVDPDRYEKWVVRLQVEDAIHKNGSQPEVHTPEIYVFEENRNPVWVGAGDTLRFRWLFAVTQDSEDIGNPDVPEGEYFLRTIAGTGPVT
jgi:hypothetical protein